MFRAAHLVLVVVASSCLLSATCPVLSAAEPADSKPPVLARTPEEARERLQRLVDVDVLEDDVPPDELRAYLERITGITVTHYGGKAINLAFRVRQMPVQDVLDLMLEPVGLYWSLKGATLVVGPRSSDNMATEVYDVHDLLGDVNETPIAAYSGNSLIELISSMIDPTTWAEVGGAGAIKIFSSNGRAVLVISQAPKTHRKIVDLLAQLRAVPREPSAPQEAPQQTAPPVPPNGQKPPEKTGATAAPNWWAALASHVKRANKNAGYSLVSPVEFDSKLLAWCVINVDQVLTIKALVWNHPRPQVWELCEYECLPLGPRAPGEALWRRGGVPWGSVFAPAFQSFDRPPVNRDISAFLARCKPWPFEGKKRGELLAGEVRQQVWLTTIGEKPGLTLPADVPRHFDAPNLDLDALAQGQTDAQFQQLDAKTAELAEQLHGLTATLNGLRQDLNSRASTKP